MRQLVSRPTLAVTTSGVDVALGSGVGVSVDVGAMVGVSVIVEVAVGIVVSVGGRVGVGVGEASPGMLQAERTTMPMASKDKD